MLSKNPLPYNLSKSLIPKALRTNINPLNHQKRLLLSEVGTEMSLYPKKNQKCGLKSMKLFKKKKMHPIPIINIKVFIKLPPPNIS